MRIVALVALLQAAFLTATEDPSSSGVRHVDWKSKADLLKRKEDCEMGYWKMKHAQESANRQSPSMENAHYRRGRAAAAPYTLLAQPEGRVAHADAHAVD